MLGSSLAKLALWSNVKVMFATVGPEVKPGQDKASACLARKKRKKKAASFKLA